MAFVFEVIFSSILVGSIRYVFISGSTKTGIKLSEETKIKMSISASNRNEEWNKNHSDFMKTFRHTNESKNKIANKHRGMKRSEETRKRMSERMKLSYELRKNKVA